MAVSFIFFTISTFFLICAHRVMLWHGKRTLAIFLVYPVDMVVLGLVSDSVATMFLYALLSALAFIFFITPVLGDVAPTSRILFYLREHPRASALSLVQLFSDKEMIEKRLGDLEAAGFIRKKTTRYTASVVGKLVFWATARYLRFIDWEPSV